MLDVLDLLLAFRIFISLISLIFVFSAWMHLKHNGLLLWCITVFFQLSIRVSVLFEWIARYDLVWCFGVTADTLCGLFSVFLVWKSLIDYEP